MFEFDLKIPDEKYAAFQAKIKKLNRVAYENGYDPIEVKINNFELTDDCHLFYDVTVLGYKPVIKGYTFVAKLKYDNFTKTNFVTRLHESISPEYITKSPVCEHCNIKRKRIHTYLLRDRGGDIIQVGKTCLAKFFDINLASVLSVYNFIEGVFDEKQFEEFTKPSSSFVPHFTLDDVLNHAAQVILVHGFISRSQSEIDHRVSTSYRVSERLYDKKTQYAFIDDKKIQYTFTDEELKMVADAKAYFAEKIEEESNDLSSYLMNVKAVLESTYVSSKALGVAVSIIGCYKRELDKRAKAAAKAALPPIKHEHFGEVKSRYRGVKLTLLQQIYCQTIDCYLIKFRTEDNMQMFWFTTRKLEMEDNTSSKFTFTVRKHELDRRTSDHVTFINRVSEDNK